MQKGNQMTHTVRRAWAALLLCAPLLAQAACPTWPNSVRFSINGFEVTDRRTGLVWDSCAVGYNWSAASRSCVSYGGPAYYFQEAMTAAASKITSNNNASGKSGTAGWRVPNIKELVSLRDSGCGVSGIAPGVFTIPVSANVNALLFSSTPFVDQAYSKDGVYVLSFQGDGGSQDEGSVAAVRTVSDTDLTAQRGTILLVRDP